MLQVDAALDRGLEAAAWNSSVPLALKMSLVQELVAVDVFIKLLYTTPESLLQSQLRDALKVCRSASIKTKLIRKRPHSIC